MPKIFKQIILYGKLIKVRPITVNDSEKAYQLLNNKNVLRYLLWDGPRNIDDVVKGYQRQEQEFKSGSQYHFAIERLGTPGIIGSIGARIPRNIEQIDIGYWLGEPYWNNGYMTEAIRLICHFCFQYIHAERIYAEPFKANEASKRVLQKNGFSVDGVLRHHFLKLGEWHDAWFMSLLKLEWEKNQGHYEPQNEVVNI